MSTVFIEFPRSIRKIPVTCSISTRAPGKFCAMSEQILAKRSSSGLFYGSVALDMIV